MKFLLTIFSLMSFLTVSAQGVKISGVVTHEKQPQAGVTVTLQNTSYSTLTDEQGRFELSGIAAGEYQMEISSVGFITVFKKINVDNKNLFVTVQNAR
jgi:hypothetical protein